MRLPILFGPVITLGLAGILSGQQTKQPTDSEAKPQTKLEAFLAAKGTIIVKDYYALGKVGGLLGGMSIDAVVMSEPGNEERRIRGLRIEVTESGRLERSGTSFLDLEEIESLSKGLVYMSDLATKWKGTEKQEYTEVVFATKGDFRIGFYQQKKAQRAFAASGSIGAVQVFIATEDFPKLKTMVDQAFTLLQGK